MRNGTRLLIKKFRENIIVATILTRSAVGQLAYIPRIPMIPTDLSIPFKRLQYLVKISFALTINKSHSQTFSLMGIDLREACFFPMGSYILRGKKQRVERHLSNQANSIRRISADSTEGKGAKG